MITATVGLSPNGDTLLLGGPLRSDKTKVILAGFNVAERRERRMRKRKAVAIWSTAGVEPATVRFVAGSSVH
jgi:hypothetical protein